MPKIDKKIEELRKELLKLTDDGEDRFRELQIWLPNGKEPFISFDFIDFNCCSGYFGFLCGTGDEVIRLPFHKIVEIQQIEDKKKKVPKGLKIIINP